MESATRAEETLVSDGVSSGSSAWRVSPISIASGYP